jgi:hypothetical protein
MASKINKLLQNVSSGIVLLSSWLVKQGYSRDLQHRYIRSGWLESIGTGALKRSGDKVDLSGAIYSLQTQAGKNIHIGGRSALALQGYSHYLELYQKESTLYAPYGEQLPLWFVNFKWETDPILVSTNILPVDVGLVDHTIKSYSLKISSPERALLECLYLVPTRFDIQEAWQIMEGLTSLRPANVQELLVKCNSVKVNRLFLFLAEKAEHPWFKYINTENVKLGSGSRSIFPGGVYVPKYRITIPQSLA